MIRQEEEGGAPVDIKSGKDGDDSVLNSPKDTVNEFNEYFFKIAGQLNETSVLTANTPC